MKRIPKKNPVAVLIDNDPGTRRLVRHLLEPQGYLLSTAENGELGLREVAEVGPDVVILELVLADFDGLTVLRRLREWTETPVLVLSTRRDEADKVTALDTGANDYLTKPFGAAELLARLRVLRRSLPGVFDGPLLVEAGISIDGATQELILQGQRIKLTPTEQALLRMLVRQAGRVVTCAHLLRSVWGSESEHKMHDLQVYIAQLRKKLQVHENLVRIRTEGSFGYCLSLSGEQDPAGTNLNKLTPVIS